MLCFGSDHLERLRWLYQVAESLQHRRHPQQHHALQHHCQHGQYSSGSSLHAAALLRVCEEIVAQWTLHLSGKTLRRRWENVGSQDTSNAINAANALQMARAWGKWLGLGARKVHWQVAKVQKSGCSSFCLHRRQVVSVEPPISLFRGCAAKSVPGHTRHSGALRYFLLSKTSLK